MLKDFTGNLLFYLNKYESVCHLVCLLTCYAKPSVLSDHLESDTYEANSLWGVSWDLILISSLCFFFFSFSLDCWLYILSLAQHYPLYFWVYCCFLCKLVEIDCLILCSNALVPAFVFVLAAFVIVGSDLGLVGWLFGFLNEHHFHV